LKLSVENTERSEVSKRDREISGKAKLSRVLMKGQLEQYKLKAEAEIKNNFFHSIPPPLGGRGVKTIV
jgi:hypothetical protein